MKVSVDFQNYGEYHDADVDVSFPLDNTDEREWRFRIYVSKYGPTCAFCDPEVAEDYRASFEECEDSAVPRDVWLAVKRTANEVCRVLGTNPLIFHAYYDAKL